MIFASLETDLALLLMGFALMFAAVVLPLLMVMGLAFRAMQKGVGQTDGAKGLAKKVAAKGAVEVAKRLFWKRFG